jgi:uncharacterized paraquat-inducible protein A
MAPTQCKECGHEISDAAPACPRCGAPAAATRRPTGRSKTAKLVGLLLAGLGAALTIGAIQSGQRPTAGALMLLAGFVAFIVGRTRD